MNVKIRFSQLSILLFLICSSSVLATPKALDHPVKAVVFDAFVIFDARPLVARAEQLFPGHGAALCSEWRTRQFEYTWLRSMSDRYADFWKVTEDALVFAAKDQNLNLTENSRKELMNTYLELKAWPDVVPVLRSLKAAGIRLGFLSNLTPQMLDSDIKSAFLDGFFEQILSTDKIRKYKPDPRAYQMAIDAFGLQRKDILFAAFAGWDAAGAKSFGYTTFWVNRSKQPAEELDSPDAEGENLNDLLNFISLK
jgi:2-haloacid dehalogenase